MQAQEGDKIRCFDMSLVNHTLLDCAELMEIIQYK